MTPPTPSSVATAAGFGGGDVAAAASRVVAEGAEAAKRDPSTAIKAGAWVIALGLVLAFAYLMLRTEAVPVPSNAVTRSDLTEALNPIRLSIDGLTRRIDGLYDARAAAPGR